MGFVSNSIIEGEIEESDKELQQALLSNTRKVASQLAPGSVEHANRLNNHLLLTQKLIVTNRGETDATPNNMYVKSYIDVLPKEDMSTMIYWDQASLNVIDSKILIETYKDTLSYYQLIYKLLVDDETSPYRTFTESKQAQLSLDEFLWAFSIVGSRSLVLNNTP